MYIVALSVHAKNFPNIDPSWSLLEKALAHDALNDCSFLVSAGELKACFVKM